MTSHDNLRDRIADVIAGEEEHPHPRGYAAHAQAVIDEFGLRWEHQPVIGGTRKRIIGDWKGGKEGAKK